MSRRGERHCIGIVRLRGVQIIGEGAGWGPKVPLGCDSFPLLMEPCGLALLIQAPCHLDKMSGYDSLPGGLEA